MDRDGLTGSDAEKPKEQPETKEDNEVPILTGSDAKKPKEDNEVTIVTLCEFLGKTRYRMKRTTTFGKLLKKHLERLPETQRYHRVALRIDGELTKNSDTPESVGYEEDNQVTIYINDYSYHYGDNFLLNSNDFY